jgi:hypothetical protein
LRIELVEEEGRGHLLWHWTEEEIVVIEVFKIGWKTLKMQSLFVADRMGVIEVGYFMLCFC